MREQIKEGPNYYIRYYETKGFWMLINRSIKYRIYLFTEDSSVARKILKGRAKNLDHVISLALNN